LKQNESELDIGITKRTRGFSRTKYLEGELYEVTGLDWTKQCFTSTPTQYRLYGRRFYRSKDPTNSIKVL